MAPSNSRVSVIKPPLHFVENIHNFFRPLISCIRNYFPNLSPHIAHFVTSVITTCYSTTDTNNCYRRS